MIVLSIQSSHMRGYFFGHYYISEKQHGIQGIHAFGRMVRQRDDKPRAMLAVDDWLKDHETVILLSVHDCDLLDTVYETLLDLSESWKGVAGMADLPVSIFHEPCLRNIPTSVFTVFPEEVYSYNDRTPQARAKKKALLDRVEAEGFTSYLDAARSPTFEPIERAFLISYSFPLA